VCVTERHGRFIDRFAGLIKAKDSPWYAVLMGSVASTVGAKVTQFLKMKSFFHKIIPDSFINKVFFLFNEPRSLIASKACRIG
jgi:hypothetical protein